MRFGIDRFLKFLPLVMLTFVEGEAGGDGGGASVAERALEYLNEPVAEPAPAAAVTEPAKPGAAPAAGAEPLDDAALAAAAAAGEPPKPGEPVAAAAAAAAPAPVAGAIDPAKWHEAEPVQKFIGEQLGDYGKGLNQEQLGLVLQDSRAIYEICDGKRSPEGMLALMQRDYPQAFKALIETGAKMQGMALAKPGEAAAAEDPAQKQIRELNEKFERQEQEKQQAATQETRKKAFDGFCGKVTEVVKKSLPITDEALVKDASDLYGFLASAMVNSNPQITGKFEKGDYSDVERMVATVHNRVQKLFSAWAKGLVAQKTQQANSNPKVPARGAAPAPAGTTAKRDLSTPEGRTSAAMEYMDTAN